MFTLVDMEILVKATHLNKLRTDSIIKVDRIVTVKKESIIAVLGKLSEKEQNTFQEKLKALFNF